MNSGLLRHNVVIEEAVRTRDAHGQNVPTWATVIASRAEIKALSGRQLALAQANQSTSTATHSILMRWRDLVPGKHRIRYGPLPSDGYLALTEPDYLGMTEEQYLALSEASVGVLPRYFEINAALDPDGRRVELRITATEVVGRG